MSFRTAEQLAQAAYKVKLLTDSELQDIWNALGSRSVSVDDFKQHLVRRSYLTSYQMARLERGETAGFFYDDYKVLYLIGSGSFARVYRAEHQKSGEIVALKVLRRRYMDKSDPEAKDAREQFLHEGETGMRLRHSNIVPIYDVGVDGRSQFLVMEFVEGRDLREFIKVRKQCEPDEALRLMYDVACGLDYALTEFGIAHRDIKLSNVLVSTRGTAKLVDFGLTQRSKKDTEESIADNPNPRAIDYAGLERASGVRRDDNRSDIFFVGCMLYHLLTGVAPLPETKARTERLKKSRFRDIEPIQKVRPGLPLAVVGVVSKALQFDAMRRYQTPNEMAIDLERAISKLHEPTATDQVHDDDTVVEEEEVRRRQAVPQRAVMIVDSNPEMQDLFREKLRASGFRVLVTSDPQRALSRFSDDEEPPAQCVVFCTQQIGEPALEAYESFVSNHATSAIAAVLLLGADQHDWADRVGDAEHQVALKMPITMGEFRRALDELVPHATVSLDDE